MVYEFKKVRERIKKYMVHYNNKWIHFGHINYQHFKDSTPLKLYKHLDHNYIKRRNLYRKRAQGITNKKGEPTYLNKNSPNFWAFHFLW